MDREKLLEVIKEKDLDYTKPIPICKVYNIMSSYNDVADEYLDFYLEWLTTMAWEWDETCYLDYYDDNARAIILIDEVEWMLNRYNEITNEEDLADLIISWDELVEQYRQKFLVLKKK